MNIWLLKIGEAIPLEAGVRKLRTVMLAETLVSRGHSVVWWTSSFDHFKKDWVFRRDEEIELKKGFKVRALKGFGYNKNVCLSRIIDHRLISRKFKMYANASPKPDLIVAALPAYDLAYEACKYARRHNIPFVVDIRDQWPDLFLKYFPSKFKMFGKALLHWEFKMCRYVLRNSDAILAMMNTLLEWGVENGGRKKTDLDRVFYLGYKPLERGKTSTKEIKEIDKKLKGKFVVTFVGTFNDSHNPELMIDCAAQLKDQNIIFIIAGNGQYFEKINAKASLMNNVLLPGWLDQIEVTTLLEKSHVGICPTGLGSNADFFPNKAFSYLSAGLPVLSAFQGDLKDVINEHGIGFWYSSKDADALTAHIQKLYEDSKLYEAMSGSARRIFNRMFHADRIYEDYAKHLENIVISKKG